MFLLLVNVRVYNVLLHLIYTQKETKEVWKYPP